MPKKKQTNFLIAFSSSSKKEKRKEIKFLLHVFEFPPGFVKNESDFLFLALDDQFRIET